MYALGGNALQSPDPNSEQEFEILARVISDVVDLLEAGWHVVITHGNGPQVGHLLALDNQNTFELDEWVAATQSMIGYRISQAMSTIFTQRGRPERIAVIPTRVLVDPHDQGFLHPTKPIGPVLSAEVVMNADWDIAETIHGPRRVVASPKPIEILEIDIIQRISDLHAVTICCGGGGIPIVQRERHFSGIPAVIDKDLCSALLATSLKADAFVITTAIPAIATDFGTEQQQFHRELSIEQLEQYFEQGEFPPGSMAPKVRGLISVKKSLPDCKVCLCEPGLASKTMKGLSGTTLV